MFCFAASELEVNWFFTCTRS